MHFRQTEIEREREKKSLTCPFGFVVLVVVEVVVVVVVVVPVVDTGNCPWSYSSMTLFISSLLSIPHCLDFCVPSNLIVLDIGSCPNSSECNKSII